MHSARVKRFKLVLWHRQHARIRAWVLKKKGVCLHQCPASSALKHHTLAPSLNAAEGPRIHPKIQCALPSLACKALEFSTAGNGLRPRWAQKLNASCNICCISLFNYLIVEA